MANRYPITYFCDECGELFPEEDLHHYTTLPWDIASARKGESGSVCDECDYFHNNPVLSTGHNAEEVTMTSLNDYHEMNSYGRMLLREAALYYKCQAEAAEFQAEQDALALKREYMVQKHAAADLRMQYALEAYDQHLTSWKQANHMGHDYHSSDHCSICGAEQYEGNAYYGGCTPATEVSE